MGINSKKETRFCKLIEGCENNFGNCKIVQQRSKTNQNRNLNMIRTRKKWLKNVMKRNLGKKLCKHGPLRLQI